MGFWGPPNIAKLIEGHNTKELWKACANDDYEIRKEAILGLIKINELLPNPNIVFCLISDSDPLIRRVAYNYNITGEFGLYSSVSALHDNNKEIRIEAISTLKNYYENKAEIILPRAAQYDPDISVRENASLAIKGISKTTIFFEDLNYYTINDLKISWLSDECLMDDFLLLIKKENTWNPIYQCKNGNIIAPYSSPIMFTCKSRFIESRKIMKEEKQKAENLINNALGHAVEGLNSISSQVEFSEIIKHGPCPYTDYIICSSIMISRLNR